MGDCKDPYLVFGTGRSGTSFVADVLHNNVGICMGEEFVSANSWNPDGYWEDVEFYGINTNFIAGHIVYKQWVRQAVALIMERQERGWPWGFKDARLHALLGWYLGFFDEPRLIWCRRKRDLVIASLKRCYGFSKEKASALYRGRELVIGRLMKGQKYLEIYFDEKQVSRETVINAIKERWPNG